MKAQKFLKYFVLLLVTANLAIMAMVFLGSKSPPPTPMPNPNGYDDFVKAAQLVAQASLNFETLNKEELSELVTTNEAALNRVRVGLGRECRVPDDFETAYTSVTNFNALAYGFAASGKLAEWENRTNDAVRIYLEEIRFGQKSSHGGAMLAKAVYMMCESLGLSCLQRLTNSLDAEQCLAMVQALETIDSEEESPESFLKRENAQMRRFYNYNWWERIEALLDYKEYKSRRTHELNFTIRCQTHTLQRRRLMITFAARAYTLEKNTVPKTIDDLVPAYLEAVPQDPIRKIKMVLAP